MLLDDFIKKENPKLKGGSFLEYEKKTINHDVASLDLLSCVDILNKFNLKYNILFGTLLGLYRDKKLIEYDYDMDVGLDYTQESGICDFLEEIKNRDFKIIRYIKDVLISIIRNDVYIDLYLFKKINNQYRCDMVGCSIDKNDFEGGGKILCNSVELDTILNIENFFFKYYGRDWKTPIKNLQANPKNINR